MRVVHLVRDSKFVPLAQSLFEEAFPGCNTYLMAQPRSAALQWVTDLAHVRRRPPLCFKLSRWWPQMRRADLLVVHGMTPLFARAVPGARRDCVVAWIGWGSDYYRLLEGQLGPLLLEQTAQLEASRVPSRQKQNGGAPLPLAAVAGRIDVFSVNPSEVELLRRALPELRAAYHALPSFTVEDAFERGATAMDGPDVLLGNSATPENNHLEALDVLAPLVGADRRLVVPLSYGDASYAEHVDRSGRERFGGRFEPLRTWMPIEAYNARLQRCGFVLMNHRRQQAVGNISAALYKGAKVFLRPENPLFGFYRGLGALVHSTETLEARDPGAFVPLSGADRERNREVVLRRWGRANVVAAVRGLASFRR